MIARFLHWFADHRMCKCGHTKSWHVGRSGECDYPDCQCLYFKESN